MLSDSANTGLGGKTHVPQLGHDSFEVRAGDGVSRFETNRAGRMGVWCGPAARSDTSFFVAVEVARFQRQLQKVPRCLRWNPLPGSPEGERK